MPFPIIGLFWLIGTCTCAGGVCYLGKKAHDAYQQGQKTKRGRLDLKDKSLETAREDNKNARDEEKKLKEELEEQERKNKELEKELEQAKNKANDLSLSEEERTQWRRKMIFLEEQLNDGKSTSKSLLDRLKGIGDRIKNNNKIISGVGLNTSERHWVWDFLTLENILIAGACYAMYKILKDDK